MKNLKFEPNYVTQFFYLSTLTHTLGHVVSKDGVMVDPSKIEKVRNWVRPTNVSEIRSFVRLASYTADLSRDSLLLLPN